LAEEISQSVFADLTRAADKLSPETISENGNCDPWEPERLMAPRNDL
jgi:hypothetical protein